MNKIDELAAQLADDKSIRQYIDNIQFDIAVLQTALVTRSEALGGKGIQSEAFRESLSAAVCLSAVKLELLK